MTTKKPSADPMASAASLPSGGDASAAGPATAESAANILLVDDDPRTLMAMEALLAGPDRAIFRAQSGEEALRRLLRQDFALILLDVRMPEMDGFETAALIRRRERSRYTPIIFLSAVDTLESNVLKGASSGAVDYLFKPVVPEVLRSKVAVFVDLFHMNERLKRSAVQQSEERFRLLVESIQDYAIFMLDPEGRVTSWNTGAERIKGFRHEEVIGEHISNFFCPEDQAKGLPAEALRRAAHEGRFEQEGWRLRKGGSRFWGNTIISALQDERDVLVGFSVVSRDLTEQKRVEEIRRESEHKLRQQAQELEQQLIASGRLVSIGEITASMAHEFNNPLGIIRGFAQDLLSETETSSPQYRGLQIIEEETRRCEKIIQELLQFARPRNTDLCLTDIKQLIEKTLNLVTPRLYKQRVESVVQLDENLPRIYADPQQLEQVLVNLYLNAIDAMPEGGKLNVGANVKPADGTSSMVVITVADTGFGIDKKDLAKIFQPFFTAKKKSGLGLGLPICDRIIKNHGGKIEVESQPRHGTTFKVYLSLDPSQMS
jgi:PAS domain S-box-containing protein